MRIRLSLAVCLSCFVAHQAAAETKREVLFDIVGDFNRDGMPDRAVMIVVGPGKTTAGDDLDKDRYGLGDGERADLLIYMGGGNAPLDISKPATFEKQNIADKTRDYNWVTPLTVNNAGSLQVNFSEAWGSTFENDEVLTLRFKNDAPPDIIGYDHTWAMRDGQGSCSVNLPGGAATVDQGTGKVDRYKVAAQAIPLSEWIAPVWDKICEPYR